MPGKVKDIRTVLKSSADGTRKGQNKELWELMHSKLNLSKFNKFPLTRDVLEATDTNGRTVLNEYVNRISRITRGFEDVRRFSKPIITRLLDNGADVNTQDDIGCTPLHYISYKKHLETMRWLLDYGADPNKKNKDELSPIAYASSPLNESKFIAEPAVMMLIDYGADPKDVVDEDLKAKAIQRQINNASLGEDKLKLIKLLSAYVERIDGYGDIYHGFNFFKKIQGENRQANRDLAEKLITELRDPNTSIADIFSKAHLKKIRHKPNFIGGIHSDELNDIIDQARHLDRKIKIRKG